MSLLFLLTSGWWPFAITLVSLVGPFLFRQLRAARREEAADDDEAAGSIQSTRRMIRRVISIFVLSNAIYILYSLLLHPLPNVFSALRIPFTTPAQTIRALLLQRTDPLTDVLPDHMELLLAKLESFEVRTMYARFGHNVIARCVDCTTFLQFGLYALPTGLLDYIRNVMLYGLVTLRGTGRERLRLLGTGVLVSAAAFEAWWLATVDIQVPRDGLGVVMWHDRLYIARQAIFLLVPTIAHNLPASPVTPVSPLFLLSRTAAELEVTDAKARALDLTHSAAMRNSALRANSTTWWANEQREAQWARRDTRLAPEAENIGLGFDEAEEDGTGKLLAKIRAAVKDLGKIAWGWEDREAVAQPQAGSAS